MNEVKQKLRDKIIEPAANNRSVSMLNATIITSNEKSNLCDITFTAKDGKVHNEKSIPVLLSNTSMVDWFPSKGDSVLVQEKENKYFIMGPGYNNYSDLRNKLKLQNDIYSDSFVDSLGGFIY